MLQNTTWSDSRSYRTGSEHEPIEFYLNAFANSNRLDLLLGYFSFTAISVLSVGFAKFILNGGKMRVVANNILSKTDKEVLVTAKEPSREDDIIDFDDFRNVKYALDGYGRHFFECMAWLIREDRLEFVIVKPKGKLGISHYKEGVFYDGSDEVMFAGSCNFTAYGLVENLERLDAYLSWENSRSSKKINDLKRDFERLFRRLDPNVDYVPVEDVLEAIKDEFGNKDLQQLLTTEQELLRMRQGLYGGKRTRRVLQKYEDLLEDTLAKPRFPYASGPREYQKEAYRNWVENGYKGIFAMATGTGKTITSLNCVLNECQKSGDQVYHAFILVPTITLVNQWAEEAKSFNFQEVITVSSKTKWESKVATTLSTARRIPTSFIIIGTYASFIRDRFNKYAKQLPSDTIFIADEAHNIGSRSVLEALKAITLEKRIGLSATPKRVYDPEGSRAMESFFNDKEPYTYGFSMERAINEGILCKYDYHPHLIELTNEELSEYIEISKRLARFYNPRSNEIEKNDIAEKLLLKRKRIIHKAENKLTATLGILRKRHAEEGSLLYTFVYVPEGYVPNVGEDDSVDEEDEDNIRVIQQYTHAIGSIDSKILVNQFIGGMPDRDEILNQFREGTIQVIASMKCLDEGVDIPRAEHAIFCSSTGNPRQFIQRRGRILRKHPEKHKAVIHDLVVIPNLASSTRESDTFNLERNMVKKEIERVMYFASLSENPYETEKLFEEVCNHYDLNIYSIYNELKSS